MRVIAGEVFDVAADLRQASASFGRWASAVLAAQNKRQMWIPPGFAHGFLGMSDQAEFLYRTADYYAPEHERYSLWNDPTIGVSLPLDGEPSLSKKKDR